MNPRCPGVEANGIGVADEMHVVTAVREFEPQLGGHDSTAAVGGIARNPDVHLFSVASETGESVPAPICPFRFSSGLRTLPPPNQTLMADAPRSISGSQTTSAFQLSCPAKTAGSLRQATPSRDCARPIRRRSSRSRPV